MTIEELNTVRKNQGISYKALSKAANVPVRTIEDIFGGKTKSPRLDTLQAIACALGVEKEKPPELSDGEKALLELFSRVPADKQEMVVEMIRVALKSQE